MDQVWSGVIALWLHLGIADYTECFHQIRGKGGRSD
jgi:hypothetical protein